MKTKNNEVFKTLIKNAQRDDSQTLLKDFDDGYCPHRGMAMKFAYARVLLMNVDLLYNVGSKTSYKNFVSVIKTLN